MGMQMRIQQGQGVMGGKGGDVTGSRGDTNERGDITRSGLIENYEECVTESGVDGDDRTL